MWEVYLEDRYPFRIFAMIPFEILKLIKLGTEAVTRYEPNYRFTIILGAQFGSNQMLSSDR